MAWQRKQEGQSKERETEKALGHRPGEGREWSAEMGRWKVEDIKGEPRKTRQRALKSGGGAVTREDAEI